MLTEAIRDGGRAWETASRLPERPPRRSPASVLLHDGTPWGVMVRGRLMQPSEQGAANTVFHNKSITPTGGGSKPRRLSRVSHYALPDSVKGSG